MSQAASAGDAGLPRQDVQPTEMTAWVGWIFFAGAMMVMLGSFHVIEGLVAVFKDEVFLVGKSGLVINVDYTVWGWTHLLLGLLIVFAGVAVLSGSVLARTVGVVLAGVSALLNLLFLPAHPVWSVIIVTVDVLVIYALIVHGRELHDSAG